jgi:hypothetical protein
MPQKIQNQANLNFMEAMKTKSSPNHVNQQFFLNPMNLMQSLTFNSLLTTLTDIIKLISQRVMKEKQNLALSEHHEELVV